MKADVVTGEAREVWHNQPNDRIANTMTNPRLAGNYVIRIASSSGVCRTAAS
jgi:hypothetical protein